jgi:putative Ca2+/H+ antiporter (TMEM165/GDT1 family)
MANGYRTHSLHQYPLSLSNNMPVTTTSSAMRAPLLLPMPREPRYATGSSQQCSGGSIMTRRRQRHHVSTSVAAAQRQPNHDTLDLNSSLLPSSSSSWPWSILGTLGKHASIVAAAATAVLFLSPSPSSAAAMMETATNLLSTHNVWYASLAETGFYQAFSLVFVSELGDKTFFIAGLLAMKTTRWISAVGSIAALTVMTLISVAIGQVFHVVPAGLLGDGSLPLDDICAALAFLFFGIKTLKEALEMDDGADSASGMDGELAEAQEAVNNQNNVLNKNTLGQIASIFALVFAAEFGDRSFLSTIALSAAQKPWAVAGGAICAHALATGVAVTGGSVVAKYLSEKVIGLIGGTLFVVFAITTVLGIF